jgi:hypothetical protein
MLTLSNWPAEIVVDRIVLGPDSAFIFWSGEAYTDES